MSDDENQVILEAGSSSRMLTAEYKDGQMQIVEVTPFERSTNESERILPEMEGESSSEPTKYMQVLNPGKGLMQLDLLNFTLVRCEDGSEGYRLVSNAEAGADENTDATVACVLQTSDGEEQDNQEYVMVKDDQGSLVFLQSALDAEQNEPKQHETMRPVKLTPTEILERAKALQKAKALMSQHSEPSRRGRKRKSELPPPQELLSSPNFRLFLYSCKSCNFKCNAIKELTAHKAEEHGGGGGGGVAGGGKWRGGRAGAITLQCARCTYRGNTHSQLMKHVQEKHVDSTSTSNTFLDSAEVAAADVLVCGACGFESASKALFRAHIMHSHGAS